MLTLIIKVIHDLSSFNLSLNNILLRHLNPYFIRDAGLSNISTSPTTMTTIFILYIYI